MATQPFPKFVSLGALSLLVFVFTVILLVAAAPLFIPNSVGFVFAISRRTVIIAAVIFFTAVAVALCFFARALQRRHLN